MIKTILAETITDKARKIVVKSVQTEIFGFQNIHQMTNLIENLINLKQKWENKCFDLMMNLQQNES